MADETSTWARVSSPTVQRAARRQSRERRIEQVRPGWWVYSHNPESFGMAGWDEVTATGSTRDPATGRTVVRLELRDSRTGRRGHHVEAFAGVRAQCCTRAEARRAGLTPT